jgi:hypothetical protein
MSERNQTIAIVGGIIAALLVLVAAAEVGKSRANAEAEAAKTERARIELQSEHENRAAWDAREKGTQPLPPPPTQP